MGDIGRGTFAWGASGRCISARGQTRQARETPAGGAFAQGRRGSAGGVCAGGVGALYLRKRTDGVVDVRGGGLSALYIREETDQAWETPAKGTFSQGRRGGGRCGRRRRRGLRRAVRPRANW